MVDKVVACIVVVRGPRLDRRAASLIDPLLDAQSRVACLPVLFVVHLFCPTRTRTRGRHALNEARNAWSFLAFVLASFTSDIILTNYPPNSFPRRQLSNERRTTFADHSAARNMRVTDNELLLIIVMIITARWVGVD